MIILSFDERSPNQCRLVKRKKKLFPETKYGLRKMEIGIEDFHKKGFIWMDFFIDLARKKSVKARKIKRMQRYENEA